MADTLSADVKASLAWLFAETGELAAVNDNAELAFTAAFADGTSANQADQLWHAERTVAASSNDDLDLTALPRTLFGNALSISFAKVKAILLERISQLSEDDNQAGELHEPVE